MDKEMTRYAFMEHMKDYMKQLLRNPLQADTDDFLHGFGIDGPTAVKMLIKRTDPNDEYSAIMIRKERIKDNGYDENGKRNKDTFEISYKIPRKDFKKKLRNLYINLFEQNIINENLNLTEGAWGYDILDNDSALDFQSEFAKISLNVLCSKVSNLLYGNGNMDADNLWAHVGVLVDFLKKYKDDEIQLTDNYTYAINLVENALNMLYTNENFTSVWDEPKKIKSSIKKIFKEVSLLKYQKDIMNGTSNEPMKFNNGADTYGQKDKFRAINEDGEGGAIGGGAMDGVAGATNAQSSGQYTTPLFGKPIKRKSLYLTQEQIDYIKEATATSSAGNYQYDVPLQGDDDFYGEAMDHKDIMKKSFNGEKE